jgi:putative ABC transport system ATP-binding protein
MSRDDRARLRRRAIGYVFQDFNLLPGLTAAENVALPLELDGMSAGKARAAGLCALEGLGLADRAARFPDQLSGGERQRVAIARAVVGDRRLVLADEPTGALDSEGGSEVIELMRRLHRGGQTIILVTHDPDVAAAAERVVRMRDGRIVDPEPAIGEDAVIGAR